jgi:hypothetical protein
MAPPRFSASALIAAPAQQLYAILADYNQGHQRILPRPPFVDLTVEKGGVGAGTEFSARMRVLGRLQAFRAVVTEPEPGRVLVETTDTGYVTSFIVEPRGADQSFVTIATELIGRPALLGAVEGWLVGRLLRPGYVRELEQLAALAASQAA